MNLFGRSLKRYTEQNKGKISCHDARGRVRRESHSLSPPACTDPDLQGGLLQYSQKEPSMTGFSKDGVGFMDLALQVAVQKGAGALCFLPYCCAWEW